MTSHAVLSLGRRRWFLGCPIDLLTEPETVDTIDRAIARGQKVRHVVVNVAKLVACRRDPDLRHTIESADIVNVDGMGIVWGARVCGIPVPERVTGIDLMCALLQRSAERGYRTYFLGSRADVLSEAVRAMRKQYPGLQIAGCHDGYFKQDEEAMVVDEIRVTGADLIFIAMPSPQKERFSSRNFPNLDAPFIMGVGGSLDVIAGYVDRAPRWMQRAGLEWAHRLMQEPRRMWRRYLVTNAIFAALVACELCRLVLALRAGGRRRSTA